MENNKINHSFFLLLLIFLSIFIETTAFSEEFYAIERPSRKYLKNTYLYNIDVEENTDKRLDLQNIEDVFIEKQNQIYNEQKITNLELYADKEEKTDVKKRKFISQKNDTTNNVETKISKKEGKTNWLDDWIPKIEVKPFEVIGTYTSLRLMLTYPFDTNISAKEKTQLFDSSSELNLFTGKAKFYIMPSLFIAIGNDKFKYWKYEVELGYLPILASNTGNIVTADDVPGYTFYPTKKDLSFHLLTISLNNFVQYSFFNKRVIGYFGIGIGAGYAWTMGNTLSSDFVLPFFKLNAGISFMATNKSKINIGYTIMYTNVSIPNNFSFNRTNSYGVPANNIAIQGGQLKFSNFLINGFNIEYQFYTK